MGKCAGFEEGKGIYRRWVGGWVGKVTRRTARHSFIHLVISYLFIFDHSVSCVGVYDADGVHFHRKIPRV